MPASAAAGREFKERADEVCALFSEDSAVPDGSEFFEAFDPAAAAVAAGYIETIQGFTPGLRAAGVQWLQQIVDALCGKADALLRSMDLFEVT